MFLPALLYRYSLIYDHLFSDHSKVMKVLNKVTYVRLQKLWPFWYIHSHVTKFKRLAACLHL